MKFYFRFFLHNHGLKGKSILKPALLGLIICICGNSFYFTKYRRINKNQESQMYFQFMQLVPS